MALSDADKARWAEIDRLVDEHKKDLKAATSHETLKTFAEDNGLMNENDFGKFKFSLRKISVSYDELRKETFAAADAARAESLEALDDEAPTVMLWSGAVEGDDGSGAYAICDDDDNALWYGNFFADDKVRVAGDLVSAEQSAAEKAVWLASKALEAAGQSQGRLYLHTTCPQLEEADLKAKGARLGVAVDITVNEDLRAVQMAEAPGFKKWQDSDLAALVETADE